MTTNKLENRIKFGSDAIQKIKKGIDITCNSIKSTIGPKGRNGFLYNELQPKITNDGISIANAINQLDIEDKFEKTGVWLVTNTSSQTNDDAGDGTTTTAVLLQAIIDEALKRPENPMDIKRSLAKAGAKVTEMIKESSKEVKESQITDVATISSESKEIGELIADVFNKVGKNAPVIIEDNNLPQIDTVVTEGLEMKVGFVNPVFINNSENQTVEYDDILVFATERKISNVPELKQLLEVVTKERKENKLMIICSDIENQVVGSFALSKLQSAFNAVIVKAKGWELEDMASVSGATLITETSGIKFSEFKSEYLGLAKRIVVDEKKTLIVGNNPDKQEEAANALMKKAELTKNIYEAKNYKKRAEAIRGKVAVIRVGAPTDSEKNYLKDKIEDAVNATKSALEEGLVEGGGTCLFRISQKLKGNSIGEEILKNALKAPLKAIIENAGKDYTSIVKKLNSKKGYDAATDKNVDMFKNGIVDPAKVTRCAFQNALSSASNFITAGVSITDNPIKK